MSVNKWNKLNHTLTKIAGSTQSKALSPSVSLYQDVAFSVPAGTAGESKIVSIELNYPMPDNEYVVNAYGLGTSVIANPAAKTPTGFQFHLYYLATVSESYNAKYEAFKLMVDQQDDPDAEKKGIELTTAEYNALQTKQQDVDYYITDYAYDPAVNVETVENRISHTYDFSGMDIQFFGDSIAYGVGVDNDSSDLSLYSKWTTMFCSLVNATETNNAVSGSCYTRGVNEIQCIPDTIKNATLVGDVIFLCGGINDWQLGVEESVFETAVEETFRYLSNHYSGKVVVVSPFNVIKNLIGTPTMPVYRYRLVLAKKAFKYGFDFIDGGKISLAQSRNAGQRVFQQYSDGLHPSGFGHYLCAHEIYFQFTGLDWHSFSTAAGWCAFSGEYLDNLGVPIWKITKASLTLPTASSSTDTTIFSQLTKDRVILQGYTGCVMYNTDYSACLPWIDGTSDFVSKFIIYADSTGTKIQHKNDLDIINGNIFLKFIRWFDMNHTHSF